jgi:hypothetical protein
MMGELKNYVWIDHIHLTTWIPYPDLPFFSLLLKLKKELGDGRSVRVTLPKTIKRTNTYLLHILGWGHGLVRALPQHLSSIKTLL